MQVTRILEAIDITNHLSVEHWDKTMDIYLQLLKQQNVEHTRENYNIDRNNPFTMSISTSHWCSWRIAKPSQSLHPNYRIFMLEANFCWI